MKLALIENIVDRDNLLSLPQDEFDARAKSSGAAAEVDPVAQSGKIAVSPEAELRDWRVGLTDNQIVATYLSQMALRGGFYGYLSERLKGKVRGTLERLEKHKNFSEDYYNRAVVNLRSYVVDIVNRWRAYIEGHLSEAQVHSLGSIYDALLGYSVSEVRALLQELVDYKHDVPDFEPFLDGFMKRNSSAARRASGGGEPAVRLDPLKWLQRLPEAALAKRLVGKSFVFNGKDFGPLDGMVRSFRRIRADYGSLSERSRAYIKAAVNAVYAALRG